MNHRNGSLLHVVSLLAVVTVAGAVVAFGFASYARINAADRRTAQAQARYVHTEAAVYRLCLVREHAENRLRRLERADVALQQWALADERARQPTGGALRRAEIAAFLAKLAADDAYLATSVEDGCATLRP